MKGKPAWILCCMVCLLLPKTSYAMSAIVAVTDNPLLQVFSKYSSTFLNATRIFSIMLMTSGIINFGIYLSDGFTTSSSLYQSFMTMAAAIFILAATDGVNAKTGELAFQNVISSAMAMIRITGVFIMLWGFIQLAGSWTQGSSAGMFKALMSVAGGITVIIGSQLLLSLPSLSTQPGTTLDNIRLSIPITISGSISHFF